MAVADGVSARSETAVGKHGATQGHGEQMVRRIKRRDDGAERDSLQDRCRSIAAVWLPRGTARVGPGGTPNLTSGNENSAPGTARP